MNTLFKFNLILMISLLSLLITDVVGSSSLNPYAEPYSPTLPSHKVAMVSAIRNGLTTYVPKKSLLRIEDMSSQEIKSYTPQALTLYFWTAVQNSYHKAAYKIAEVLYADFLPHNIRSFSNLSRFYSLMAKADCKNFSSADRDCFTRQADKLNNQ